MKIYQRIKELFLKENKGLKLTEIAKLLGISEYGTIRDCLKNHDEFCEGEEYYWYLVVDNTIIDNNSEKQYDRAKNYENVSIDDIEEECYQEINKINDEVYDIETPQFSEIKKHNIRPVLEKKDNIIFNNQRIINHRVRNKNNGVGVIVGIKSNNQLDVDFGEYGFAQYIYPNCFVNNHLCFVDEKDYLLIEQDVLRFKHNSDEEIEKRNKKREEDCSVLNFLNKHLSCIKKAESVSVFCDAYIRALAQEIQFIKTEGKKKERIINGELVAYSNGKCVYSFETESELNIHPESAIEIINTSKKGTVIVCEENRIMFCSNELTSRELDEILISYDANFLLKELQKRLYDLKNNYNSIVYDMICKETNISNGFELSVGQEKAIEMATKNSITYIWGPPGTGKTYTLAKTVKQMLSENKRVLMLSHSNVAVDDALLKISKEICDSVEKIVRYGYPRNKELLNDSLLTSYNLAINNKPHLKEEREQLEKEKDNTSKNSPRYKEINDRLNAIRESLKQDEIEIINNASFIATTLSKAVCDKSVYNQRFDMVIIDEASMAYVPQIIFSASLAKSSFCCIGDFNQLPPIVQNKYENSPLKVDIYEYCCDIKNLVLLNTQYRMHEGIAKFISRWMYKSLLQSAKETEKRKEIADLQPFKGKCFSYVDVGDVKAATKLIGSTHLNIISAFVSLVVAIDVIKNPDVTLGIIAPYKEQAKFINFLINTLVDESVKHRLVCATVHQFQGSEKDVIIYDATDSARLQHPGNPITSNKNNYSNRLFNVAVTRAKGKFIVVADKSFLDANLSKGNRGAVKSVFYSLSRRQENNGEVFSAFDYVENSTADSISFLNWSTDKEKSIACYESDIIKARQSVRIDISSSLSFEEKQSLYQIHNSIVKKEIVSPISIDKRNNTSIRKSRYFTPKELVLYNITIIDEKIVWIGNPIINNELCWRIENKRIAERINDLLN